jgi:hypothetical protein
MYNDFLRNYIRGSSLTLFNFACALFAAASFSDFLYFAVIVALCAAISASLEIAFIVFAFFLLAFFFYAHLAERERWFILATVFGFAFGVPYLVPLIAGLYFGVTSIVPIALGTFIWRASPLVMDAVPKYASDISALSDAFSIPQRLSEVYSDVFGGVLGNSNWIFESLIFASVVILVFSIARLNFNYSKEVAVVLGGILSVIGFFAASIVSVVETPLFAMLAGTLISVVVALAVRFFDCVADYRRAESLEFFDDNAYYFVRVIPKAKSEQSENEPIKIKSLLKEKNLKEKNLKEKSLKEKSIKEKNLREKVLKEKKLRKKNNPPKSPKFTVKPEIVKKQPVIEEIKETKETKETKKENSQIKDDEMKNNK